MTPILAFILSMIVVSRRTAVTIANTDPTAILAVTGPIMGGLLLLAGAVWKASPRTENAEKVSGMATGLAERLDTDNSHVRAERDSARKRAERLEQELADARSDIDDLRERLSERHGD